MSPIARCMFMCPVIQAGPNWRRCTAGSVRRSWYPFTVRLDTWRSRRGSRCHRVCRRRSTRKNGDLIRLAPDGPTKIGEERTGRLVLDGDVILPADGGTVNERRKMGINGLISVALAIGADGRLLSDPVIRPIGVPVEADRDDFIADATDAAARAYSDGDEAKVREAVRLAVRRCATLWTGKKPIVEVMFVGASRA